MLELVAQGATNPEIATSLFIGETTVKTHVSRLLTKLGAENRVQIALVVASLLLIFVCLAWRPISRRPRSGAP